MTKTQIVVVTLFIILVLIVVAVVRSHDSKTASSAPSQDQVTAANDCITLCQSVFDGLGNDPNPTQEKACENTCYTSAGLSTTTGSQ